MSQVSFFEGSKPLKITKPLRLIELFAGIGAQAKALENLGVPFEHYRICEFDKYAVKSYNAVHGTDFALSDITQIHAADLGVVDTDRFTYLLTYSFPCTDLSKAGKQQGMSKGGGTRSGLLWEVERLLTDMDELPQVLLMENVPDVIGEKFIGDFAEWLAFLDRLGYTSKFEVLNAVDYGMPQNRARCFMVSWLGDYYYDFPTPRPLERRLKDLLEPEVDERYYLPPEVVASLVEHKRRNEENGNGFGGQPVSGDGIAHALVTAARKSNSNYIIEPREVASLAGIKGYNEMNGRIYDEDGASPTVRANSGGHNEIKVAIKQATIDGFIECDVGGVVDVSYPQSNTRRGRVQGGGAICPTITASSTGLCKIELWQDGEKVEQYVRFRRLTEREDWRLMGFSDEDFDRAAAVVSNAQLQKQAGNSIVVDVLMAIFDIMF